MCCEDLDIQLENSILTCDNKKTIKRPVVNFSVKNW